MSEDTYSLEKTPSPNPHPIAFFYFSDNSDEVWQPVKPKAWASFPVCYGNPAARVDPVSWKWEMAERGEGAQKRWENLAKPRMQQQHRIGELTKAIGKDNLLDLIYLFIHCRFLWIAWKKLSHADANTVFLQDWVFPQDLLFHFSHSELTCDHLNSFLKHTQPIRALCPDASNSPKENVGL